jgi:hypothetical protein
VTDSSPLALIIDHDLGFLLWLGDLCDQLGWQTVPALHCRQALAWLERFALPVAVLVVNPELRGAKRAVTLISAANPDVRVVLVCDSGVPRTARRTPPRLTGQGGIQARYRLRRPSPGEPISRIEWLENVRRTLA